MLAGIRHDYKIYECVISNKNAMVSMVYMLDLQELFTIESKYYQNRGKFHYENDIDVRFNKTCLLLPCQRIVNDWVIKEKKSVSLRSGRI